MPSSPDPVRTTFLRNNLIREYPDVPEHCLDMAIAIVDQEVHQAETPEAYVMRIRTMITTFKQQISA